jgi:hypothetical protein
MDNGLALYSEGKFSLAKIGINKAIPATGH